MSGVDVRQAMNAAIRLLATGGAQKEADDLLAARKAVNQLFKTGGALLDGEPGDEEWERFEAALNACEGTR